MKLDAPTNKRLTMPGKRVRIDVTAVQWERLWKEVFSQPRLSGEQRRRVARTVIPLPVNGAGVDLFCEGKFVGAL